MLCAASLKEHTRPLQAHLSVATKQMGLIQADEMYSDSRIPRGAGTRDTDDKGSVLLSSGWQTWIPEASLNRPIRSWLLEMVQFGLERNWRL